MKKISLLIISIFVLFFLTFNPFLSICFAGSGTSDNSISGEVKLYEAVEVRHETTYGEDIGFWSPTGGEVGIWDKIWGTVSDAISDAINTVASWFAGTSFIQKAFLAALVVFAAVAVAILLIFGSAAALAAVVIGLIGAAVVGIYAAIVGEDGFSFWAAMGLGIGGAILAVVVHFTGAAAAVLGFLTQTALPWLTRAALPAVGRFLLRGWGAFTTRFLPWVKTQGGKVWAFLSEAVYPKLVGFFNSITLRKLFAQSLKAGIVNGLFSFVYQYIEKLYFDGQLLGVSESIKVFGIGFFTGFAAGLIPGFLIAKNIIREGKLFHRIIGVASTFSFDILGNYMQGESTGPVEIVVALISSISAVEIGIRVVPSLGEVISGFIGSIAKFAGEGFKRWQADGFFIPGLDSFKAKFAPKFDHWVDVGSQQYNELVVDFKGIKVPDFGKRISIDVDLKGIGDSLSKGFSDIGNSLSEIDFDLDLDICSETTVDTESKSKQK